ncbi:hypothetical protein HYW54_00255 [Candidatus Gottesmanbacteria bacterium]|nr:hypothetical protein [Candidatus Gottesmanbacteria bacterium]
MKKELVSLRDKIGIIFWPEVRIRPSIKERTSYHGRTTILLGGGTPFSDEIAGVRVGGINNPHPSDFLSKALLQFADRIDPEERIVFHGLSEDHTLETLNELEKLTVKAINGTPESDTYLMIIGSDMAEVIGEKLHSGIGEELEERGISFYLVWANKPVTHTDSETLMHVRVALEDSDPSNRDRKNGRGGVFLVSNENIISAHRAMKETWHGEPMKFFDFKDKEAVNLELARRKLYRDRTDLLSYLFFQKSFESLIEAMDEYRFKHPKRNLWLIQQQHGKKWLFKYLGDTSSDSKRGWLLHHLTLDPVDHPRDSSGRIVIKPVNLLSDVPTYEEFQNAEAVLFILNHSATTRKDIAEAIRVICGERVAEGRSLAAFAVTENGEPRTWNPVEGIYPSATILKDYVVLLPMHIKPAIVKLWAGFYSDDALPTENRIACSELIDFMLNNYKDEIMREPFADDVQRVKRNLYMSA